LTENLDNIKRMEDAGAAALVLHSLFEEHVCNEGTSTDHALIFPSQTI
jgi:dihydroorotate dehydrogenase (fumarate)